MWLLAARPKTLVASVAPVLAGTGLAAGGGDFLLLPAVAALAGALLIQIGTNLANDYYDFVRGGDTEERVGPVRVTQAGLLPPESVRRAIWVAFGLSVLVGVYLVAVGGWPILAIGVASILFGLAYTAGPYPLAYHGLGDLFILLFFGFAAAGGAFYLQTARLTPDVLLVGGGVGAMTTAILVVNNLRDIETDAKAGKRTLAVMIGRRGTQVEFLLLAGVAFAVPRAGVVLLGWTPWALLALLALIPALGPVWAVLRYREDGDPRSLNPVLGRTALATGIYGMLLAAGLAFG